MHVTPAAALGVLAALCSIGSFLPQAIKIRREKDASSVSLRMYVVTVTGFTLWTLYGVLLKSWPLIASNIASLLISAVILVLKLRYGAPAGRNPKRDTGQSRPPASR